jgi:hypothetical protein
VVAGNFLLGACEGALYATVGGADGLTTFTDDECFLLGEGGLCATGGGAEEPMFADEGFRSGACDGAPYATCGGAEEAILEAGTFLLGAREGGLCVTVGDADGLMETSDENVLLGECAGGRWENRAEDPTLTDEILLAGA